MRVCLGCAFISPTSFFFIILKKGNQVRRVWIVNRLARIFISFEGTSKNKDNFSPFAHRETFYLQSHLFWFLNWLPLCVFVCALSHFLSFFSFFSELTGLASAILLALPTSTLVQHRRKEEKRGRLLTRCAINKSLFALFYKPATRSTQLVPDQC